MKWLIPLILVFASCEQKTELSEGSIDIYHLVPLGDAAIWATVELDSDTIRNGGILTGKLYLQGDDAFKKVSADNGFNYRKKFYHYSDYYRQSLKIGSDMDTVDIEMRVYEPNLSKGSYAQRSESLGVMASFSNKTDSYDTAFILTIDFTLKGY
jgi:hypothetical protein